MFKLFFIGGYRLAKSEKTKNIIKLCQQIGRITWKTVIRTLLSIASAITQFDNLIVNNTRQSYADMHCEKPSNKTMELIKRHSALSLLHLDTFTSNLHIYNNFPV